MREPNVTRLARQGLLVVVALVVSSTLALGATYYVRPDGSDANSGLTNDPAGAWRTIDHAADTVSPGDVVRIQPGTYSERVTPSRDGSYDAPITFVADGAVTVCGWDMASRHYIRIIGFVIDTNAGGCSISLGAVGIAGTSSHLEFWNNVFRDATYNGIRTGIFDVTTNSLVIGNTFHSFGIGNPSGIAVNLRGNHNLFAYNEIHSVNPDAFVLAGTHNRWLNNYTHNLMETYGGHSDVFQAGSNTLGLSYNLFEANFQSGSGSLGDEHTAIIQNLQPELCSGTCGEMKENIFRRNVFHNVSNCVMGIAYATVAPISQTRYYHNTTASAHRNSLNATAAQYFYSGVTDTYFFNNIEFESWGTSTTVAEVYYSDAAILADFNLAYDPSRIMAFRGKWLDQTHPRPNVNPGFVDYAGDDFTLGASSGAVGSGGPLTVVSGSGTGTTFSVARGNGGFFRGDDPTINQYGGHLVVGDRIVVGTDVLTVISVSADAVTVDRPFTWVDGEPVLYGATSRPDIGAYPYKAGGYALTAHYSKLGGSVNVSPSDPDLVRFVVCYEDGIPTTVDSSSPYTCSVGDSLLDVRVYPAYASKMLFVPATLGPAAATDLKIIRD